MKSGSVSKSDCFYTGDQSSVCGVLSGSGNLLWSTEFDSADDIDREWNQETGGGGWGNNEAQFYTNDKRNVEVNNGELKIVSKHESFEGKQYTSARLISKKKFKYGFFEIRAKVPTGRGIWPGFWLLAANR